MCRNGTLPPICNSPGTEDRDIVSPWANLHHGVLCWVPNCLKLQNKMPRYRYLDRRVNPEGHSYTYGVCGDNQDQDVFGRRVRDESNVVFRAPGLQPERSVHMGCVGALHTYPCSQPADSCTYKKIREVQGLLAPHYFASTENELFYELKGSYALPLPCGGYKAFSTNVKDIVLVRSSEMSEETKIEKIRAQDVSYAAEIRSLSLFLTLSLLGYLKTRICWGGQFDPPPH